MRGGAIGVAIDIASIVAESLVAEDFVAEDPCRRELGLDK